VPIIRPLRGALPWAGVHRIRGVLNGTANFVLGRIEAGCNADDAVEEAKALGFAEADPSRDLDGLDTADKIRVLAWLAFDVDPGRLVTPTGGIRPQTARIVADARAFGRVVRLVGECARSANGIHAAVEPVAFPPTSPLAGVTGEENIVVVDTDWNGTIRLAGPGAGGRPTASAILADMIDPGSPPPAPGTLPTAGAPADTGWILSVREGHGAARAARELLGHEHVAIRVEAPGPGETRFLTMPAEPARLRSLQARLTAGGLDPLLTRASDD
jgi:hypothetical protein